MMLLRYGSISRGFRLTAYLLLATLVLGISSSNLINPFVLRSVLANSSAQTLPFSQDWSNNGLITTNDDWSGVAGIEGYLGQDITTSIGADPQTLLGTSSVANDLTVLANQTASTSTSGDVAEFHATSQAGAPGANSTIGLQGSATADAPYVLLYLNTLGQSSINITYNLRDIDCSTDSTNQQVALQYRVGNSGNFTNLPAGYVADATTGPSICTAVTPVSVTLPAAANNQSLVEVRIITTNAPSTDEWVGIDDINVTAGGGVTTLNINDVTQAETDAGTTTFIFTASLTTPAPVGGVTFTINTADGTINPANAGSDYVAIVNGAGSIAEGNTSTTVNVTINGDTTSEANETFFVNLTGISANATAGDVQGLGTITNDEPVRIRDIQGASHISPYGSGFAVSNVPGIVTALRSNGFFIQDPSPDSDDATSEGIFVFTSSAPSVSLGDSVTVSGSISEFRSGGSSSTNLTITELTSPVVLIGSTGNPLPPAIIVGAGGRVPPTTVIEDDATGSVETSGVFDPAADGIDFYECLEGMRVQVNNAVVVGPSTDFGEITVVGDNGAGASVRTTRGGIVVRPTDFNPERILLDDAILAGSTPQVNVNDTFTTPVVGIMDYSFGNFKLLVTSALTAVSGGLAQETTATNTTNQLSLATFNVENLDPDDGAAKFNTLANLIVSNLKSPDLIGVEEVQDNNGPTNDSVVDATITYNTLISAITTAGGPTYQFRQIDPVDDQDGGEPGGNIRVGFLFRTDRGLSFIDRPGGGSTTATTVINVGGDPQLSSSPGRIDPTNSAFNSSRKPLVGEFTLNGQPFFVIGNHFNSKGGDDPLFGRNQPPILSSETQRNQQAQIVNNFVDSILAVDSNANVVVMGDINDFEFSTSVTTLKGGVLNALIESLPQNERYSYVFEGNSQTLDHILVSNNIFNSIPFQYDVVHVNSEFAINASDHDPSLARFTLAPTAADGNISGRITDPNGFPVAGAVMSLSGTQNRKFITDANGYYHFDNVETTGFYTVRPSRANYSFSPAERSFSQIGNTTEAVFTGSPTNVGVNPLDTPEYFVRQHYLDFLGREPDESGFNFWSDQILECGNDSGCAERRRINVSAAYFLSIEFQETGGLVDRLYRASFGRPPQYAEFMPDSAFIGQGLIVGNRGWEQQLATNKRAFVEAFTNRAAFRAAYDNLADTRYVDNLLSNTEVSYTQNERDALVSGLRAGTLSRAALLQRIAEDQRFVAAKSREAFVMMEYFGYLRREPDESGYRFWLNKLNEFGGDFERAEMVKAFIDCGEYRARFPR